MKQNYLFTLFLFFSLVISYSQVNGDFQSKATGNWESTSSWETWSGGTWVAASNYPGQIAGTYTVTILSTHTITVSTNLSTTSIGDVIVTGSLNLQGGSNPKQISLNTALLYLTSTGILNFSTQKTQLYLPNNAAIKIDSGGNISGACSYNTEIYIDNKLIAVCNGGGGSVLTFGEIVAGTGTLNANIISPPDFTSTICNGTNIALSGGYTGTPNGAVTYLWTVKDPNNTDVTISNSTSTLTSFTPSLSGQYIISFTVTDGSSFSNTETKTVTVQSLVTSGSIDTAQTICSGTSPNTLTSTANGTGDGTITYEWQTNASGTFATIAAATAVTYSPPTLTTTTSYQRRTVSTLNGVACYSANTSPVIITVGDTTPPTLTTGANQTANTDAGLCTSSIAVTNASFSDNCSGITISYTLSGATTKTITSGQVGTYSFNKGVTNINYTVTDAVGNTTTGSKTITVTDNINPTLTAGANQTANTDVGLCTASVAVTDATFSDNCTGSTISYTLSGVTIKATTLGQVGTYTFNKGVTTINYTVTDAIGNFATGTKTVTVTDNINPTLTAGANQTANTDAGLCTASVVVTDAIFSDNCTGSIISYTLSGVTIKAITSGQVGTYIFNKGVTAINYTVTDGVGRTATGSKTITVTDNIPPTLTVGIDQTANTAIGLCTTSAAVTDISFSDNCTAATISYTLSGVTIKTTTSGQVGTYTFNKGVTTINYTVTDAVGNITTGSKTVTVTDNINPTLTVGANQTANTAAGLCTASVVVTDATFSDNCTGATISYTLSGTTIKATTSGQVGTYVFNKGVTTIGYTATDATGNTTTGSKTVTVTDNINPTLTVSANQTANTDAGLCTASVTVTDATFSDNCTGSTISYTLSGVTIKAITSGQVGTYAFNKGLTTINYTVTDAVGNTITGSKTVTVTDNINPTLTTGVNQTANTDAGLCTASVVVTDAIFSDNCTGATISYTLSGVTIKAITSGQVGTYIFNKGVTNINYTVTDAVGNTITGSKTITVTDNIFPSLTTGANQTANTTAGLCTASVAVTNATFSDNCTGPTISYSLSGATIKTTTVGQVGTYVFNKGITSIDYVVTDAAGNITTGSKTVTVTDNINPTLTAGANQTVNTDAGLCNATVTVTDATFSDNCTGSTISYTLSGVTIKATTSGQVGTYSFNKGVTTINYTVTDAIGNTITGSKTVTITDNINPTLTAGANQTANTDAGLCSASVAVTDATFSDNCTGSTISYTLSGATTKTTTPGQVGTYIFNKGVTTINYTVTDGVGRTATGSKTITVTDNIPPTLTVGIDQTANTTASCTASVVVNNATFSDNCTGSTISYSLNGATIKTTTVGQVGTYTFNKGITSIDYIVTDAVGNITTGSKTVTVTDNINPTLTAGTNQTANTTAGSCSASVAVTNATFADNCTGQTISYFLSGATVTGVTSGQVGTYTFNKGVTTINYTVTDAVGNTITGSKTVTVTDNINPTLTSGANQTANTDAGLCTASVAVADATFSDNCTGSIISYTLSGVTIKATTAGQVGTYIFNKGVTTINYTVTDAVGNTITGSKTVTVNDNINPTISCPSDVAVNVGAGTCTAIVVTTNPTTADNCAVTKLTWALTGATTGTSAATAINNLETQTFNLGTTTVTYTVSDAANNSAVCSYTVIVTDNIDPVVIAAADIITTTSIDGTGNCTASLAISNASTSDNCSVAKLTWSMSGATTANSPATGINQVGTRIFNKGTTSITYTITDGSGRTATDIMTVTINDNEKPTTPTLANITAQCSTTVSYPTTADNCDGTVTATTGDPITYNIQSASPYIIHWSFKDSSGNETLANQNVYITDTTAPVPNVTNLAALNISGCQVDSLTAPTATDNCAGTITGTPSITFPFTTQGSTVITWTYNDGNGNTKTQTQNLTLTTYPINGGNLLGYLTNIETIATARDNIAITSCPNDSNPISLNLSSQIGTIIQWEKFEAGNNSWQIIANTTNSYNIIFNYQNTKSTLFRVLVQVGNCTQYSNMVDIHAIPPDVPPILEQNLFTICLNNNVTLVAHNGYTSASAADDGGDFNSGQFPNKWDPTQWKIDGQTAGAQWTAAGNNTKFNNWAGTNNHPVGTLYRIEYDSNDLKFGIAHGNYNSAAYIAAYPPGNATTLETPIFSLVGLKTASIDFDQAYNLHSGDIAKLELSLDGGVTYTVTLQNLLGTSPHALSWGDTHGTPVAYPYQAPKSNNSTTTYFNFQNDNSSFDISDYIGNNNVRVRWTFFGTTDESAWAIDNITIPVKPYSDQLEWTDGLGDPNVPPLASGNLDVAYTFAPTAPGVHQYGATSIINSCRAYDPAGTALATVNVNYSYAGEDIAPASGKCGGTTVTLNAYDNTKTAAENKTNGAYPGTINSFCDDPGTGQTGTWSIVSSTSSCGTGSFSNVNNSKSAFNSSAGTYVLRWTVAGCTDDVQVILENCNVIDFDGNNDFVNFSNNHNLNSSFTINVWVKPGTQPASGTNIQTIFSKRNGDDLSTTNGYDIRLDNNNYISFNWNNGGTLKASNPISTSRWYHISVTYNGSSYKLYIDGLEVGSTSGSAPLANDYNCLLGGMYHNASANDAAINFFSGWMDELQIWNTALTSDQIHQIMNQKIEANGTAVRGFIIPIDIYGTTWANLLGYYRMDNLICGYLQAYSGKGVNGRLMNINSSQSKTAPLPYTTIRNGNWTDRGTSTTPWLYGDSVWDYPNSTGINGQAINWNIVVQSNNLNSDDKDITLLGLISNTGTTLKVVAPGTQNESNSGHLLWLTHYLKLNGFIDLIGESQLLQKRYYTYPEQYSESIFDEASSGYIERDQQGHKNSYNYNYWSSPVSIRGGASNSTYSILNVLRDGTDSSNPKIITFGDGAYFADGALSSPIKISNRWIWAYNSLTPDSNTNWQNYYQWKYIANTGLIKVAEGFTMKGTGGSAPISSLQNYVFTGKPNSGTINNFLAIQQTYLIGNPYPSALDADEFIKDNIKDCTGCKGTVNSFGGALYFWDHFGLSNNHILAQYEGGYATYTLTGGVRAIADDPLNVNNNANGSKLPGRYIPVAQGFFIDAAVDPSTYGSATAVQGGPIVFQNSQRAFIRETSGNSTFIKIDNSKKTNAQNSASPIDNRAKIRLGFYSPIGSHRQILLGADNNTTNKFDFGYDARMIDLNKNDMYWELGKLPLIIQSIPNFDTNQIIPIGIKIADEGLSKIKIDALENIPNGLAIYLYDNTTKTYYDLRKNSFEISLAAGDYTNRFSLQFANNSSSISDTTIENGIIAYYTKENKMLNIKNNISDVVVKSVSLFNILKQNIGKWNIDDAKQNNIQIPITNVSSSVYIVLIKTDKGEFSQKIIIK
ncbi:MAG: HYR domain-containing protein [Bacteroidota bacterium]